MTTLPGPSEIDRGSGRASGAVAGWGGSGRLGAGMFNVKAAPLLLVAGGKAVCMGQVWLTDELWWAMS